MDLGVIYTNMRTYLEEIASQQKQILAAVQQTNELLGDNAKKATAADSAAPKVPKEAVGPVTVETVQTVDSGKKDTPAVPRRTTKDK